MKVAIIGYTPHRQQAPWGLEHKDWELWLLNDLYLQSVPPMDPQRIRWFELHPWEEKGPDGKPATYSVDRAHTQVLNALAEQGARVYLRETRPEIPKAQAFPYQAIYEFFRGKLAADLKYFTNTISFEIALALMEMAQRPGEQHEIGIYGVDMMTGGGGVINNEYGYQRPSCEYWIAAAEFMGVRVHLPVQSDLLKSAFVYGDYDGNAYRKKIEYEMGNCQINVKNLEGQIASLNNQLAQWVGRRGTLEWLLNSWMPGDNGSIDAPSPMPNAHKIQVNVGQTADGQKAIQVVAEPIPAAIQARLPQTVLPPSDQRQP